MKSSASDPGLSHLCYLMLIIYNITAFSSYLLTCGSDGDVRIYKDFDDSDPESVRAGDNVSVVLVKVRNIQSCFYFLLAQ